MTKIIGAKIIYKDGIKIKTAAGQWRYEHHVIWEEAHGPMRTGQKIHFINGDKMDVRLENLTDKKQETLNYMAKPKEGNKKVGSERIEKGRIQVKIAEPNVWRYKHQIVWEAAYGLLPKYGKLYFINGNKLDVRLENLTDKKLGVENPGTRRVEVGTEKVTKGYIRVKIADPSVWRFKHQLVWEAAYGPIPKGYTVNFRDGDKTNYDLSNLVMMRNLKYVHSKCTKPLGTERMRDGYVLVKVGQPDIWKAKHHVLWEMAHGPIPTDKMVCFIDGNTQNITLDNLILLSRKEFGHMLHNDFCDFELSQRNKNLYLSMAAWAKLEAALNEKLSEPATN